MARLKRALPVAVAAVILFAVLALLGQLMMPTWRVEPYRDHITVASADTAVTPRHADIPHQGAYATHATRITIHLPQREGDVPAILREPVGAPGPRPACLFIHGSGTGAAEDFGDIANAMSSAGIITLVPAKRTDGYTPMHRDYERFARDYAAALARLEATPGVDGAKTGLYAESEGTWIAMRMAAQRDGAHDGDHSGDRSGDRSGKQGIAFSILSSSPVFTGRELMAMASASTLHTAGAPKPVVEDAAKLMSMNYAPFGFSYADFDASAARSALTMPLLVNYGTHDSAMPIEQGARAIIAAAEASGNRNVTVRYFDANHQMRAGKGLFTPDLPLADGYTTMLADWVNGVTIARADADGWATPRIAGATPRQSYAVPERGMRSGIIGSLGVLAGLAAASPLCFLIAALVSVLFLVGGAIRRRRLERISVAGTGARRFRLLERDGRAIDAWPGTSRRFARVMGYPRAMTALIAVGAACCMAQLLALAGYLSYAGWSAVVETPVPRTLTAGFVALRLGAAVCAALCAWLAVSLWEAWRERRRRIAGADGAGARAGRAKGPGVSGQSTWVLGRWHWAVALLVWCGMLLALAVMAFWGLFTL